MISDVGQTVRFYVLTAGTTKITVFWDMMACVSVGRCRSPPPPRLLHPLETCCLYYNFLCCAFPVFPFPISLLHISRLSLLVYPEDGGSSFLRNVCRKLPDYMTSHTRRHKPLCPKRWASLVVVKIV
jgi:hypothetical protein